MEERSRDYGGRSRGRSRAKKSGAAGRKVVIIAACAAIAVFACGGIAYAASSQKYKKVFLPGTTINGVDASEKTPEDVEQLIAQDAGTYTLTITERDDRTEKISGQNIGMETKFDGSLEKMLADQNPYSWLSRKNHPQEFSIDTMISYDEDKLDKAIDGLDALDETLITKPESAHLSDYTEGTGYTIVKEVEGNEPDKDKLVSAVKKAVKDLQPTLDLEKDGIYVEPEVKSDDISLTEKCDKLNKIAKMSITTDYGGGEKDTISGDTIRGWVTVGNDGSITVDKGKVGEYVKAMAVKYNTYGKAKSFRTSYGNTVQVSGGTFGWKLNQSDEGAQIEAAIAAGETVNREAVWSQKGTSHENGGIGNTYVEVNLTGQHLFYYKNGSLVLESDFVSGNVSKGHGTPDGVYTVAYKQRNATLKGENYSTPVSFWMPFNNGIGFHDATWRSQFGGTIYKTSGSHGCINMPYEKAKALFNSIDAGCVVVCYGAAGTESKTTSAADGTKQTTAAATTAAPTKAPETAAPTKAPETKAPETAAPTKAPETSAAAEGPADENGAKANGPGKEATSGGQVSPAAPGA